MKKFITIFPELENVHLIKDVGMIPYMMMKEYGYHSSILSYQEKLAYLETDLKGLNLIKLKKYTSKTSINVIIYLLKNAKNIDFLNLFHVSYASIIWIFIYKFLNSNGKIYLKMDTNIKVLDKSLQNNFYKRLLKIAIKKCEVVSCETEDVYKRIRESYKIDICHIPNGVKNCEVHFDNKKEKIIMTAGRLGSYEKNTELLVDTFIQSLKSIGNDWKLYLVGPLTDDFKKYINKIIEQTRYKNNICLLGEITSRTEIEKIYRKAKIFAMPSKWEGFSLAGVEAIARGCFLLSSDLACFREMTNNGEFGYLFQIDNQQDFYDKMVMACRGFNENDEFVDYNRMEKYVVNAYTWERICGKINGELQKCQK